MGAIAELPASDSIELLRFSTAGSVDDGKSTLIGRLLYDSKSIFEDQISAIDRTSRKRGADALDLSLLTDGLIAEREQGITIDVAYRYFATPKRKFIIADTPGHEQYTRNMVTGASTADLAIVLIDAAKGLSVQSRRHALIAHLLGIPHVVVAVNKMDLVGYGKNVFDRIREDFSDFCARLGLADLRFVPLSALRGDMVVNRGENLSWYAGPTLLELLESVRVAEDQQKPLRFPVQLVSRPAAVEVQHSRGYMGRIESGSVSVGDSITVLPSGHSTSVRDIVTYDGSLPTAHAPQSVTLMLDHEIDISRGDMLVHADLLPRSEKTLRAHVCWMDTEPLSLSRKYLVKHSSRTVKAVISAVEHRIDVQSLETVPGEGTLKLNDIGVIGLKLQQPLVFDSYGQNRATGSFIVIDEISNHTVGAGMII
jgi:sulfate adenylyltransferase subunit 1